MDLTFTITNIITMMGLAVGIDYSLFILSRFREERQRGLDKIEAIAVTGATASKTVFFSGITVMLALGGLTIDQIDVIELNEAFASQAIAVLRELGLQSDDARVNRNGGAIALGHPLGMSGARIAMTATEELHHTSGRYAMAFMCIGVGQGIALLLERV